jgi:hypothetical protein
VVTHRSKVGSAVRTVGTGLECPPSGDGWDFYLDSDVSRGHNRTVVGTLDTETAYGNQRSRSSTYWVLTLNHAWGTSTISNRTSFSSNTGGSIVALADGSFGTYVFTRSINAAGQGTSPWSGEQSKRIEASGEYIDTGADDELISDSFTTLSIDDDWTNEESEHHETTRYGGVDQEPYSFTTQDTYETDYETQRQTAEDTLGPHIAANQVGAALATGMGVVQQNTNYNGNGFGNAGTGSGSVQPDTGSGSGSGYSGPETGPLPDGGYWEHYDDGSYWYYAEYDDGHNLTYWEDGHHETFSINTALSAAQGAGTGSEESVEDGDEVRAQYSSPPQLQTNANEIAEAAKDLRPDTYLDSFDKTVRTPSDTRGNWVEGTKGDGVFQFSDTPENRDAGVARKKFRFKNGHLVPGGFPKEAYYKGSAKFARVRIDNIAGTDADYTDADKAMRAKLKDPNWERPKGYTWHHVGGKGETLMELVDSDVHGAVAHRGSATDARADLRKSKGRTTKNKTPESTGPKNSTSKGGVAGKIKSIKLRGMIIGDIYMSTRDALQATGLAHPDYVSEDADFTFVDEDGSVYIIQEPRAFNFWSSPRKKYIAGPKDGQTVDISDEELHAHKEAAHRKWGKYIPGGPFREPRFIPGTHRETLPVFDELFIFKLGWVDENGIHYYKKGGIGDPHIFDGL